MRSVRLIIFIFLITKASQAQFSGLNWAFGHQAAMNFSGGTPIPDSSAVISRGSSASITDSANQLLFYCAYDTAVLWANAKGIKIYNRNHQVMPGGSNMGAGGWYQEIVILPKPDSANIFYVFYIGVTDYYGLYYARVDMSLNGGLGAVVQKDIPLQYFNMVDCLTAIKHGNGRDWWLIFRRSSFPSGANNEFYIYMISTSGISSLIMQNVGSLNATNGGRLTFSSNGNKMLFCNFMNLIELYDFDRCTGIISNPITIFPQATSPPYYYFAFCEFSPSGNLIYISAFTDTSYIFQFDLTASNILSTMDIIWSTTYPRFTAGKVKRSMDGKIYFSSTYYNGLQFPYPYPDTVFNFINMNLGVVNNPDGLGSAAAAFIPYSYYLGGKRKYAGLPNNPDYHLGPKIGSGCDTLTALNEHSQNIVISSLWPNPNNGEFTVNYFLPNGKRGVLEVFGSTGQKVYQMALPNHTYNQDVDIKSFPSGIYVLRIQSGDKSLIKKFLKL